MRNDAIGAVAELAASRHGVFTRLQAATRGITRKQLRLFLARGVIREPSPGVFVFVAAPATWRQSLLVATLSSGGGLVASHRSAAALHRLDGFAEEPLELTVPRTRRVRVTGATVHQAKALGGSDVLAVDAIAVTSVARTLCDLGAVVPPDLVERALDDARRRGTSLRWLRDTALRLHRPGQAGTATLLALLAQCAEHPQVRGSWFEKLVELCLAHPALPALERQYRVCDARGRFVGRLDLAFPSLRLGVEAHSRAFHFGRRFEAADEDRDLRLSAVGWDVLYVGYQGLRRPDELLQLVVETAAQRALFLGLASA